MNRYMPIRVKETSPIEIFPAAGRKKGVLVRSGEIASAVYADTETAIKIANLIEGMRPDLHSRLKKVIGTLTPGVLLSLYDVALDRGPKFAGRRTTDGPRGPRAMSRERVHAIDCWEKRDASKWPSKDALGWATHMVKCGYFKAKPRTIAGWIRRKYPVKNQRRTVAIQR